MPLPTLVKAIVRKSCDQENKILAGIKQCFLDLLSSDEEKLFLELVDCLYRR